MKLVSTILPLALLSLPLVAGCAAQTDTSSDGDEVEVDADESALTSNVANSVYYKVTRRDFRKCAAPLCGGFYVKRVNEAKTVCANGTSAPDCYVSSIDLAGVGLPDREEAEARAAVESGSALFKARGYKRRVGGQWVGTLRASEAWLAATGSPVVDGTYYRTADNGIRCIKAPCPSTTAFELNDTASYNVVSVQLENTKVPADPQVLYRARRALGTKEGILVVGGVATPKCIAGSDCGPFVSVAEFYLRFVSTEGKGCGGLLGASCNANQFCNWAPGDICGAADAAGKCSYRPEACIEIYKPVCGCDGNTYGNACTAASAGVSVSTEGACEDQK